MKRFILVLSAISILSLAGCNLNENIENNNVVSGDKGNQQYVGENDVNETEKYKLAEGYVLTDDMYEMVELYNLDDNREYKFTSDNTEYVVKVVEDTENGEKVLLNDVEIPELQGQLYGVFDLNTEDNYKELVKWTSGSIHDNTVFYRVKANSKVELLDGFADSYLIKIGDRYIYPQYINFIAERVLCGYYEFVNDKFIYVDRFLNGEKLTDVSNNFNNEEYTTANTSNNVGGPRFPIYENGKQTDKFLADNTKIRILNIRMNSYNEIEFADIELAEDSVINEGGMDTENNKQTRLERGAKITLMFVPAG